MTSADFCSSIATLLSVASPVANKQISQGKARDFIPIYPVHIRPVGPDGIGLRVFWPSRPPTSRLVCTSCSSGQEFAYSFLPTPPRGDAVAVRLGVPAIKVPRGLPSFKGHLLVTSRFAFAPRLTAPSMALRAMDGAPKKKVPRWAPFARRPSESPGQMGPGWGGRALRGLPVRCIVYVNWWAH